LHGMFCRGGVEAGTVTGRARNCAGPRLPSGGHWDQPAGWRPTAPVCGVKPCTPLPSGVP